MKPNYYAIIPAQVRYNNELSPNAKLLFGEITALSGKEGKCWAQNKYFAELYNVDVKTISRWIKQLHELGFIKVAIEYDKKTKQVTKRSINIVVKCPMDKNVQGGQNCGGGGDKNVQDNIYSNIYSNNNINNNIVTTKKQRKKVSDFEDKYQNAYEHIVELFDENLRPKTTDEKIKWLDVIRLCDLKDDVNPRQLWFLINQANKDPFWKTIPTSLSTLRIANKKSGLRRIDQFKMKFGKTDFKLVQ